jgi:ATP-dependent DNA helicase RecG
VTPGFDLSSLPGVGPRTARRLQTLGVRSLDDLPFLLPRAWQDRRHPLPLAEVSPGSFATVRGQILSLSERRYRSRHTLEAVLTDGRGILVLKWFRFNRWMRAHLEKNFPPGAGVLAAGRVELFAGNLEMHHPDLSREGDVEEGPGILPIYPLTAGVTQRLLRRAMKAVEARGMLEIDDGIPLLILKKMGLPGMGESLRSLHFPPAEADVGALNRGDTSWHRRVRFGELVLFNLALLRRRREWTTRPGVPLPAKGGLRDRLLALLSFSLTAAQVRAETEIARDLAAGRPMFRLLQGDVGSGKTLVAFLAMLRAAENGRQAALMAPTEILAEQHFRSLSPLAERLGVRSVLLTSGLSTAERRKTLSDLSSGEAALAFGTHALLSSDVTFSSLALAVVDEQHRFGVIQRLSLQEKGGTPHFLVMTATPIPRSLAMVLYGDLDHSVIDQMPPGRTPVETSVFQEGDRARLHLRIAAEVRAGRQAFVVYPLVEESERSELAAAREMARHLSTEVFPNLAVGLVTGRMPAREKERAMELFRRGETQLLVSTTVIEVGVDVPNATLMVVENAERYGLFQLHQLRGRVGRGYYPSRCILMAGKDISPEARRRLEVMTRTTDGFKIAEADLSQRGPGDFLGTRQAGLPEFRFADPFGDPALAVRARETAEGLLEGGAELPPELESSLGSFIECRMALSRSG